MAMRFGWLFGLALAVGTHAARGDEGKDSYGDALPKGAKARLGTERMRALDTGAILMPDGKSLLAVGSAGISTIDVASGLSTGAVPGERTNYPLAPSLVSADGKRGLSLSYDGILVSSLDTGKKLSQIKRTGYSTEGVASISADGKRVAIGGFADDKAKEKIVTVRVWNVDDDKEIASIKVAQNNTGRVALSADGKVLATWGYHYEQLKPGTELDVEADPNRQVQLWEADTGKPISTVRTGTQPASVAVSPDAKTVAVGSYGSVKLYSVKTGEALKTLLGRSQMGRMVLFSGDGKAVAAAADDSATLQMWEVSSGKSLGITECPASEGGYVSLRNLAFPTAERLVAFATRGSSGIVWEAPSGKRLSPAGGHTEGISGLGFANGDEELIAAATGSQVFRWSVTGKELGPIKLAVPGAPVSLYSTSERVGITPNGALAYRPENNGLSIHDLPKGMQRFNIPTESSYVGNMCFNKDASKLALVIPPPYSAKPKPGRVTTVDLAKGEISGTFPLPPGIIIAAACTADGGKLAVLRRLNAVGKEPQKLVLNGFESAGGKQLWELPVAEDFGSFFLATAPAADRVFLVNPKDGVLEYDVAAGKKVGAITKGPTGLLIAPVVSEDGKVIALATGSQYSSQPSVIEIREIESGKLHQKFTGHTRPVTAMAFSKNGKMLATGSADTTILVWDLTGEKE